MKSTGYGAAGLFLATLAMALPAIWGPTDSPVQAAGSDTSVKDNQLSFSLPDLAGDVVSLSDDRFKGKVVVVDIWGTWCPPCRVEIPHLVRFHEKYSDQGLEIVGIAFEKAPPDKRVRELKRFVKDNDIEYTVLLGGSTGGNVEKEMPALENFHGYPTTIFIGRDGKVKKVDVGFGDSKAPSMEKLIVRLLDE